MTKRLAGEPDKPANEVDVVWHPWLPHDRSDFIYECRRKPFVCVERQHPARLKLRAKSLDRPIPLTRIRVERPFPNQSALRERGCLGSVLTERVDDHDLRR